MTTIPDLTRAFARIGILSFGGPAAQIALMHRELVEETQWVTEEEYLSALSFCMLLPGPEAMQLATWIGWRKHGTLGGLIAGRCSCCPARCRSRLVDDLRRLGRNPACRGPVHRGAGRRRRRGDRGAAAGLQTRAEIPCAMDHRSPRLRRSVLLCRPLPRRDLGRWPLGVLHRHTQRHRDATPRPMGANPARRCNLGRRLADPAGPDRCCSPPQSLPISRCFSRNSPC